jgi:hypothetical protein
MKRLNQVARTGLPVLCLMTACIACATFHDLEVRYRLPPPSSALEGTGIALTVEDDRGAASVLGPGAVPEFKNFPGDIAFSISDSGGGTVAQGHYRVMEMVQEAFRRRLGAAGVSVVAPGTAGGLELVVVLRELTLDLAGGRWVARMDFQARLRKAGTLLATQEISGEAERHRFIGRGQADRAVSEIFTDVVNQLDLQDLFKQAETTHPGALGR